MLSKIFRRFGKKEPEKVIDELMRETPTGVVTADGWKYVCLEGQPWLLFNLNEDPYELANLAHNTAFGTQRRRLHERLARWVAETGDAFALPELP